MHKNIGNAFALYPTPVTVVGVATNEKVNWINIAHVGIIGVDKIMISSAKAHYSNQFIKEKKVVSINLIDKELLIPCDYVGMVSGRDVDKTNAFEYYLSEKLHVPIIENAPVAMECELVDIYETDTHDNFIFTITNTFARENVLTENNKIDFVKVSPILFEMPTRSYLSVGEVIGKCWSDGNKFSN